MKLILFLITCGVALALCPSAGAAPLYTTQGIEASGFTNDSAQCSVSIIDNATGNIVETHSISNDCMNADTAYIDYSCYVYPANGTVTYTVLLGEKYGVGAYLVDVRCGGERNNTQNFNVTAPVLVVVDFSQYPQFLTTMKLVAKTETEKASECIARVISADGVTAAVMPGVSSAEKGFFSFERFLFWEAPYKNYTLNVTCNDGSTLETTFKPVFVDEGTLAKMSFGLGFQAVLAAISIILAVIVFICAHMFWKSVTGGGKK